MKEYFLANCKETNGETTVEANVQISEEQVKDIDNWFSYISYYHTCRSAWKMVLESSEDLKKFLSDMKNDKSGHDQLEIDNILITGNKLLINYLSFIKNFVDLISNTISNNQKDKLTDFQKLDSDLYDTFFGYRFLKRMRNYVTHSSMPMTSITDSAEKGISMVCKRKTLLKFKSWSTVKKEIEKLNDDIYVEPYIDESVIAINTLYLYALELIIDEVIFSNVALQDLCSKHNIICPTIFVYDTITGEKKFKHIPIYLMNEYLNDIEKHPNIDIQFES